MGSEPERVRLEAFSRDVDAARQIFEESYSSGGWHARPTDLEFVFRHSGRGSRAMMLRSTVFHGALDGESDTGDEYIVSWIKRGTGLLDSGFGDHAISHGVPLLHPAGRPFEFSYRDFEQNLVHLHKSLVHELAADLWGVESPSIAFDDSFVPAPPALRGWWRTVDLVARQVLPAGQTNALVDSELSRIMAASFLDTFHEHPADLAGPGVAPTSARLRVAVEFIHQNAAQPITSAQIAETAGITVRGLQLAFQRAFDITPTAYIRRIRLERARAELERADPTRSTVAEIARRWGFPHAGRFSSYYGVTFHEHPSTTLNR
jgi:AraC-like DNA-binding protein